jgi:hypothetical protein
VRNSSDGTRRAGKEENVREGKESDRKDVRHAVDGKGRGYL